jgi:hypothetical protein
MSEPQPDRDEVLRAARMAGFLLPAAYEAELVDAYAHVRRLVARLPQPRARGDEPAHVFDPAKFTPPSG